MSLANVLRLEDYRGKREQRLRLSELLYGNDSNRLRVFECLKEVAELCSADRVAAVWVEEYGSGLVHPHVVLDHLMDRPRRFFSSEPLRKAFELGVPGVIDQLADLGSPLPATFAISLGSDGMRAWFVLAETSSGRPLLDADARDRLMFLGGECAAVLLHRELDRMLSGRESSEGGTFAGWSILQDLEGREADEEASRRISQRFVVGRAARALIDEDLVVTPERMQEQVRRARAELPVASQREEGGDPEIRAWHRALDALERNALEELSEGLVKLGAMVEGQGHPHGALELYSCGYDIAMAVRAPRAAAEAARYRGALLRRQGDRVEAKASLERARGIAEVAGLTDALARSLMGLALLRQDAGNIPDARRSLGDALTVAERSSDPDTVGMIRHALMGLEQAAGNPTEGLRHGWIAVAKYRSPERRTRCMAGLAGALMEVGDREAAEDAWSMVAHTSTDSFYLLYAHDALGHLAALKGDRCAFERHVARGEALGWDAVAGYAKAEFLYYRGLSHRALGDADEAREWLERALAFAEENELGRVIFRAEAALTALSADVESGPRIAGQEEPTLPAAPPELREGLRAMRRELVLAEG